MDEQLIIKQCKRHQRLGQKALFEASYPSVFRLARRYVVNPHDAEDVLIEAYIRVFNRMADFEYRGEGSLMRWINTIVINECLRFLSRYKPLILEEDMSAMHVSNVSVNLSGMLDAEDIQRVIDRLPDGYRIVFNLFAIEGYSHREIADMLNISEGTSKSQLSKAREQIIGKLKRETQYGTA